MKVLGLLLVAAWGLLIAAWVALHVAILPHIDQWRAPIERYASQVIRQPVRIGALSVTSSGWVPTFELKQVELLDANAATVLRLPRIVAALSPHSLLTLRPLFSQLLIDGADVDVHRDAAGRVFIAGVDIGQPSDGDKPLANWFFKQHELVVRQGVVRWTDALHPSAPQVLADVQVVFRNSLRHHDMRIDATPPAAWGERFTVNATFVQPLWAEPSDWRRWRGTVHADVPGVDVATLKQHVTLPVDLSRGRGALRAWADVVDGRADSATLDVALRDVVLRLRPDLDPLNFPEMTGRLIGRQDARTVSLEARQFGFVAGDGVRWPASTAGLTLTRLPNGEISGGTFTAERLDLALMAQLAQRLPTDSEWRLGLDPLDPRGTVEDLMLRWSGPLAPVVAAGEAASAVRWALPPRYEVRARLSRLALASAPAMDPLDIGRPGVRDADIELRADERGGEVRVAMKQGELDLPGVFEDPKLPLDHLDANVTWRVEAPPAPGAPSQLVVQVRQATFGNADAQGEFHGTWSTGDTAAAGAAPRPRYPGQLTLDGTLTQGVGTRVARYLPLGIGAEARHYVEHAVRAGTLSSVAFRVKGDLNDFPFADPRSGEFRIAGRVEDASFAFVPSTPASGAEPAYASPWPALDELSGELVFDRLSMEIRQAQARTQGVLLSNVQGGIKTLSDKPVLVLDGTGRGPAADMLRFVSASPVGGWTDNALAQSTATGSADLKLALSVPLADVDATTVRGSVTLAASDFRLRPDTPMLSAARGRVDFTQKGFSLTGVSGRLLGGELTLDGGLQADGSMRFVGVGTATADGLRRGSDVGGTALARLATSLSGQAAYRVGVNLVRGKADVVVTSNLVGLASELPAPLRKTAESPLPLRFQNAPVNDGPAGATSRDLVRLDLGNVLQVQYVRDVSGDVPRVLRGGIGVMEPAPNPASGVAAALNVVELDTDAWQQAAEGAVAATPGSGSVLSGNDAASGASAYAGYLPTTIALRAQQLQAGTRRLNQVVATASQDGALWRVNLESEQASGLIEYRPPPASASTAATGAAGRIYARLTRLSLPKDDVDDVENLLDQPAQSVPALDIVVDDLVLRGKRLGRMELEAVNRQGGDARSGPTRDAAREWRLTRLALTTPEARLTASGNWAALGATAGGAPTAGGPPARRVVMNFKLELTDSGALIERLGFGKLVKGGKGGLSGQIAWAGSPLSLDYPSLTGQVNISIAAGQFLKADPGVGRLLGVLSLQALPRRLVLDFRDVFQQGFAFDDISGDLQITQGVAQTNNLRMRGVQAAVLMEGKADIEQETQDLRVIIVPEIDAGTASLAYAAINPAIGLGAFLAQTLFSKPLIAANTREFRVTGSWADPKVDKVERKFTDAVPDIPAPSASAPPTPGVPPTDEPPNKP